MVTLAHQVQNLVVPEDPVRLAREIATWEDLVAHLAAEADEDAADVGSVAARAQLRVARRGLQKLVAERERQAALLEAQRVYAEAYEVEVALERELMPLGLLGDQEMEQARTARRTAENTLKRYL